MKHCGTMWITPYLLFLFFSGLQNSAQAQSEAFESIPLEDTSAVRSYIDTHAQSPEMEYMLWANRTKKARNNHHLTAPYYYYQQVKAVPQSFTPREHVEAYTRYSVYATNRYILDNSLLYAYKAEDIAENEHDDYMRGKVNHALGWYYAANCDYDRAHQTYDRAIVNFKSSNFMQGVRNTLVKKAIAYQLVGKHKKSLKIYNEVYNLEDRTPTINDLSLLIKSNFKNGDSTMAKKYLEQYFKRYHQLNKGDHHDYRYYHLKSIESNLLHNDSLELYFLFKSKKIALDQNQTKELFTTMMNLGRYFDKRYQLGKAKKYFKEASSIVYKNLMHNRFNEPNSYLLKIAERENNVDKQLEYRTIQENYYKEIAQKISVNNTIENNRQAELVRQKREIQTQNQKIWILTALGFIGLGLLLFSSFYFRKYKKIVQDLSEKNELLDQSVNDKQTLLQETHHRVKNNLQIIASLLNLQRKYTKDQKLTSALIDGRNRVKSMALIHQLLYQKKDLKGINVRSYVENLMSSLLSSLKANAENIQFTNKVEPLNLHEDTLLAIGLIINEVVTNSLKYAFVNREGGIISIILEKRADRIFLSISDNGNGMPDHFDINDKSSFGYSLITSLSKKLDAQISILNEGGTTVNLDIRKFIET